MSDIRNEDDKTLMRDSLNLKKQINKILESLVNSGDIDKMAF